MNPCPAPRTRISSAVLILVAGLAGCSTLGPEDWRIEPNYRIAHTGPGAAEGYAALARRYEGERLWRLARDAWVKAAIAAPQDVEILNSLAMAEAGQRRFQESVAILRNAVALQPQSARLLNNLGYALQLAGHDEESRAVLRDALALNPRHQLAQANLGRLEPTAASTPAPSTPAPPAPALATPGPIAVPQPWLQTEPNVQPMVLAALAPPIPPARERPAPMMPTVTFEPALRMAPIAPAQAPAPIASAATPALIVAIDPPVANAPIVPLRQPALIVSVEFAPAPAAAPAPVAFVAPPPRADARMVHARVEISNGNGVRKMATSVRSWLQARGMKQPMRLSNARPFVTATTTVHYREGFADAARAVANQLPRGVAIERDLDRHARSDVRVVLGHDLREVIACGIECPTYAENTALAASFLLARK